jgi:acyl CoA:acetate/3-ketoacid CoA transferase beta subunit
VAKELQCAMSELQAESESYGIQAAEDSISWGMLDRCQIIRRGQNGIFVVMTDQAILRFHDELRHGKPYFTCVIVKL